MPDISYSVNLNVNAGALNQNLNASNITSDFSTTGFLAVTLNVGTATQAISTASASSVGLCFARSLNTTETHTVSFGRLDGTTLHEVVRLKGETLRSCGSPLATTERGRSPLVAGWCCRSSRSEA